MDRPFVGSGIGAITRECEPSDTIVPPMVVCSPCVKRCVPTEMTPGSVAVLMGIVPIERSLRALVGTILVGFGCAFGSA